MKYYVILAAIIVIAAAIAIIYAYFGSKSQIMDGPGMINSYNRISQEEAKEMMKKDDGHIIVDVRRQDEYDLGHIPGAICIPNESITTVPPKELPDIDQIILVYCRSGRRSKEAAQKLFDMGYGKVYEFGGIIDWTGETVRESETDKTGKTDETEGAEFMALRPQATLVIETGKKIFYASLEGNPSAKAFVEKLSPMILCVDMHDQGDLRKIGELPWELPESDREITAVPGDILLYQGNKIALYYGRGTFNSARLANICNTDREELLGYLGDGDVTVIFHLEWSE